MFDVSILPAVQLTNCLRNLAAPDLRVSLLAASFLVSCVTMWSQHGYHEPECRSPGSSTSRDSGDAHLAAA